MCVILIFNGKNPYTKTYCLYSIHVKYFLIVLEHLLMMAIAGQNIHIKLVTLYEIIVHLNIKRYDISRCLLLTY
jgi:hypothetical protein